MCLQRKKIYTNAHWIARNKNEHYTLYVPCGECTECQQDTINEWQARTYYQYLECIKDGGYAIWDGLSYREDTLPHLNDIEQHVPDKLNFKCFRREDIQLFLKRLRTNLKQKGIDAKGKIKYMIAGEYGQEENWTMRPHYHMILYCNAAITPIEMSMEIKRAWKLGRTSGIEDKGAKYFHERGLIQSKSQALKVANYIAKYCLKNQDYDKVATEKVKQLCKFWYSVENNEPIDQIEDKKIWQSPWWKKRKQEILKKIKTFHLQSKGYGKYAMEEPGAIEESRLGMPDKKKIYWWQKLPMYYQRKIYYEYKRVNGKVVWELNDTGREWKKRNLEKTIESYAKKLQEKETYCQSEEFKKDIAEYWKEEKGIPDTTRWYQLNDQLYWQRDGRQWKEYAEYILYHQGRIERTDHTPKETIDLDKGKPERHKAVYANEAKLDLYYNYCHEKDKNHFKKKLISLRDLGDNDRGYKPLTGDELTPMEFEKLCCNDENTKEEWHWFDQLQETLDTIDFYLEWQKSKHMRQKRQLEKLTAKGLLKLT